MTSESTWEQQVENREFKRDGVKYSSAVERDPMGCDYCEYVALNEKDRKAHIEDHARFGNR